MQLLYLCLAIKNSVMATSSYSSTIDLQSALVLQEDGKTEEAEALYRRIINNAPETVLAYGYLGRLLANSGRMDEGLTVLEQGMMYDDKNPDALSTMVQIYITQGKGEEAVKTAKKLVSYLPKQPDSHTVLGNAYFYSGKPSEAIQAFKKALKINPKYINSYMSIADIYAREGKYILSQKTYKEALKLDPNNVSAIAGMGMSLQAGGRVDDAVRYFERANRLAPHDVSVMILLANGYRDQGENEKAISYYESALNADPENKIAKENLARIKSHSITQWHFEMLSDAARNSAYREAIESVVKKGDHVLDIGAGSGLLSLMAARAGAERVTGFEMVNDLAEIADLIVEDNGYQDVIEIINAKSTSGSVGSGKEMPKKADVLVSEILDTGLLGEGVLHSHRHALKNLCVDDPMVIPAAASVKGCLIQADSFWAVRPIDTIEGFDLTAFNEFADEDTYLVQDLKSLSHVKLSAVMPLIDIDFKNLPDNHPEHKPFTKQISFEVAQDGEVHAIAFWFDLHLTDKISRSSGPEGEMVHWRQAVYYFDKATQVKKGDTMEITLLQSESQIKFRL